MCQLGSLSWFTVLSWSIQFNPRLVWSMELLLIVKLHREDFSIILLKIRLSNQPKDFQLLEIILWKHWYRETISHPFHWMVTHLNWRTYSRVYIVRMFFVLSFVRWEIRTIFLVNRILYLKNYFFISQFVISKKKNRRKKNQWYKRWVPRNNTAGT